MNEKLIIGNVTFQEVDTKKQPRGTALINYRGTYDKNKKRGGLFFNALAVAQWPELCAYGRVKLFRSDKLSIALFPAAEGEGVSFMAESKTKKGSRKKIQGAVLDHLSLYTRITYKCEEIKSPRKGWLLTALESQK